MPSMLSVANPSDIATARPFVILRVLMIPLEICCELHQCVMVCVVFLSLHCGFIIKASVVSGQFGVCF